MRTMMMLVVTCVSLVACGNGASSTEGEPAGESGGGDRAGSPPAEALAPASTADGILQRLARAMSLDTSAWDAETNALVEPGRVDPLVGVTRTAIVARLGEPNAADFTADGRAGWSIGTLESARMGHPPILVVELDAAGVVTSARFQLSM